ncbi:MAG: ankyrin repeat domain-containing protein [Candidatus Jidaibacter sp.]|nr:ankyrin repeat domain-containing protein [Candidatus Jidaibacter sp.]
MHWAVKIEFNELVEYLAGVYAKDLDCSIANANGETALDMAVRLGNQKALNLIAAVVPETIQTDDTTSLTSTEVINTEASNPDQENPLVKDVSGGPG